MSHTALPGGVDRRPHHTRNLAPLHVESEGLAQEAQAAIEAGQLHSGEVTATGPDEVLFIDCTERVKVTLPLPIAPVEGCRVTVYPCRGDSPWTVEADHAIEAHELPRRATFTFDGSWTVN
jgi:hypothetical protein